MRTRWPSLRCRPDWVRSALRVLTTSIRGCSSVLPRIQPGNRSFRQSCTCLVNLREKLFKEALSFRYCPNFLLIPLILLKVPPQIVPFTFGDDASNPGDSQAVQCMVTKGDTPIEIRWLLNGQPLVNNENKITILKVSPRLSSLSIESLKDNHRGVFKCIASNKAGQSDYAAELHVNGTWKSWDWINCHKIVNYKNHEI